MFLLSYGFVNLRSPCTVQYSRHCLLCGGTQRRALSRHQREELKTIHSHGWEWNQQQITVRVAAPRQPPKKYVYIFKKALKKLQTNCQETFFVYVNLVLEKLKLSITNYA